VPSLELVDRLKAKTLSRLVRHEIEGWPTVAGHDYGLASFHLTSELS
jgi:hypothetical protein